MGDSWPRSPNLGAFSLTQLASGVRIRPITMSARATSRVRTTATSPRGVRAGSGEPWTTHVLTAVLALVLGFVLAAEWDLLYGEMAERWMDLLFWAVLVVAVNVFPVPAGGVQLNLDMPLLLAVALLYPPVAAAALSLVAAADIREVRKEVSFARALFNRIQVSLSVLVAAAVFEATRANLESWPSALLATIIAVGASYATNIVLVSLYTALRKSASWLEVARQLSIGRPVQFLATYLGYGVLALVLVRLFVEVGAWSVVVFLIPLMVARQMLLRGQELGRLATRLRERERLLERLFDRIEDERRDERLRVAADLHDDVLQSLSYLRMLATLLKNNMSNEDPSWKDAGEVVKTSDICVDALRGVVLSLQSSPLGSGGLIPTLNTLIQDFKLEHGTKIALNFEGAADLREDVQVVMYQVAREALLNALRHANASEICVEVRERSSMASLSVADNGHGFEPDGVDRSSHFGLALMRERVRMASGSLDVASTPGLGTTIEVRFSLEKESAALSVGDRATDMRKHQRRTDFMSSTPSGAEKSS